MPDTMIPAYMMQATEFVVVSLWKDRNSGGESYDYEPHATLNDALDTYREYEDGEYPAPRLSGSSRPGSACRSGRGSIPTTSRG